MAHDSPPLIFSNITSICYTVYDTHDTLKYMGVHMMTKQIKSSGKPVDIGELKEEEEKETPLTLEAQIEADSNSIGQYDAGDWAALTGKSPVFLPANDVAFIKQNIAYSKTRGHTIGCIPVCRLSEETQKIKLSTLRPLILNLVEQHCTLRTRNTGRTIRKGFVTVQIRPSVDKHGRKNDLFKAGAFKYLVDSWTPTLQAIGDANISKDGTLHL